MFFYFERVGGGQKRFKRNAGGGGKWSRSRYDMVNMVTSRFRICFGVEIRFLAVCSREEGIRAISVRVRVVGIYHRWVGG